MRVLQVSAEIYPLVKTGGLADMTGALPDALARAGVAPRLLLPGFQPVLQALSGVQSLGDARAPWGLSYQVRRGTWRERVVYAIDAPSLYDRPGTPYLDDAGVAYADNHRRFALLGLAGAALAHGLDPDWRAQIVHAHDWHAGLVPAHLHRLRPQWTGDEGGRPASVFTVHNLAFQGLFPAAALAELGLPASTFEIDGLEFHGLVSFMKAGLQYADRITTVSPGYAREIQTPEFGCGLDGLLRWRSGVLSGILNGVDRAVWNPAADAAIAAPFDARRLPRRAANKAALQRELGLPVRVDAMLCGVVSRMTEQKGLHLVLQGLPRLLERGGQLAVLGSGDRALEEAFRDAARAHPHAVAVHIGYDDRLSHRMFAGTDLTLVPSRFEPCGLTQLYGLAYGSLPLVHGVGGLADTVVDAALENLADHSATGFVFHRFDADGFDAALRRAFALHARPVEWRRAQRQAMQQVFDWDSAAARYVDLYRTLIGEAKAARAAEAAAVDALPEPIAQRIADPTAGAAAAQARTA